MSGLSISYYKIRRKQTKQIRSYSIELTNRFSKGESALFYAEKAGFEKIIKLVSDKKDNTKKALITHQNVKLENYADVVKLAQHPEYGLALKDRRHFFIMHNKSFLGMSRKVSLA